MDISALIAVKIVEIEATEGALAQQREELADLYVQLSGARWVYHTMTCAVSCAPARMPGPCDCGAAERDKPCYPS